MLDSCNSIQKKQNAPTTTHKKSKILNRFLNEYTQFSTLLPSIPPSFLKEKNEIWPNWVGEAIKKKRCMGKKREKEKDMHRSQGDVM